jgi:hypothetical protein
MAPARRRVLQLIAGAATAPLASSPVSAQAYPARPVRVVLALTDGRRAAPPSQLRPIRLVAYIASRLMNSGAIPMSITRFAYQSLILSVLVAIAMPSAQAQAPRPGQLAPGPGGTPPRGPAPPPQAQQPPRGQTPQQPAPPKPYKPLAVTPPQPYNDPSFEAFRKQLADIANRKDRAALAKVIANNFFWMGEKGDKANKKKSGVDNLAAAIDLDNKDGSGWQALVAAASEATLEPVPEKKGVMCGPANPTFDEKAAEQMAKDTGTEPGDWAYPSKAGVDVHAAGQPNSPVIEKLGQNLVRVYPEQPPAGGQPQESQFVRVVTPSGKVGFVSEEFMSSLDSDQVCYIKDPTGWKIAGYAGND